MRDDTARTSAFYHAIDRKAPGKVVLDMGTGALALLAIRAAKAGAAHVYAVEANEESAKRAEHAVAELGLQSQVTVLAGRTDEVALPRRAELLVHELLGDLASREGVAAVMRDAVDRHLDPSSLQSGGWSIPECGTTWATPVVLPPSSHFLWQDVPEEQEDYSDSLQALFPGLVKLYRLPGFPLDACMLAAPQAMEELAFGAGATGAGAAPDASWSSQERRLRFVAEREGELAGFALHVTVDCGGGAPAVSSVNPGSSWAVRFVPVVMRTQLAPGDAVELAVAVDLQPDQPTYQLEAQVQQRGAPEAQTVLRTAFQ